ncbi:FAD-binding oxidoreductase [Amphritea sp. 2_MG-2023]|uniref:NAD(P)/FAD-dependent oxidoreductase n=1 Tax=Amphritea TaxID=515417 RepID=UPI001C06FBB6|nr:MULTISPECIES: FAD-binding oxidoreductase [Amphritea]MBU2965319.1 FAD-binding oxidoreductase [Amphritea atlantica]MDO6420182.1 FAD-binding oxidoreductase [Amphritea sp. 2_MG-2023]
MTKMINLNTPITFNDALPDAVDVVVIGGGIIGIFSALNIARSGLSVMVIEKGRIAGEQSSRNWGWIRQHGRDAAELPIMMEATRLWENIDQEVKGRTGFKRVGVMYLSQTEEAQAQREAWLSTAAAHGVDTVALSSAQIGQHIQLDAQSKNPWVGATYTASDARAEPWQAIPAIAELAHSEGVLIKENCAVRTLDIEAGQITGVITEAGRIKTAQVVVAGGAWSSLFLRRHGINIPQLSVRASVARTAPLQSITTTSFADKKLAVRRRNDGGYSLALTDSHDHFIGPDSFRWLSKWIKTGLQNIHEIRPWVNEVPNSPDAWRVERHWAADEITPFELTRVLDPAPAKGKVKVMQQRFAQRFPQIGEPQILDAWGGMIDAMPDIVPIVDRVPDFEGLIVATGMSGHGFGIGPAFGKIVAQMVNKEDSEHDLSRFRFSRFSDGSTLDIGPNI